MLTLLVGRTACAGLPEDSVHGDALASLCTATSLTKRTSNKPLPTPTLVQSGASTLQISIAANAAPLALFVTHASGTVMALDAQRRSNTTLTLPLDAMSKPLRLVPRALLAEAAALNYPLRLCWMCEST